LSRPVNISLVSYPPFPADEPDRLDKTLQRMGSYVDAAACSGSKLVAFPETCNLLGLDHKCLQAEPLDGQTVSAMRKKASERGLYVVCPLITAENGRKYNTSVLIGPDGSIIGVYHKNVPTPGEIESGIHPGSDTPVFETDFGRVGLCICFDMNYWEVGSGLCANKAELVIWSSMWQGGRMLTKWAIEFGFYIGACYHGGSTFVDVAGREILQMSRNVYDHLGSIADPIVSASLDLDKRLIHHDYNILAYDSNMPKLKAAYEKYGSSSVYTEWKFDECLMIFGSLMPNISTDQIIEEFGIETMRDYLSRSRKCRQQALDADK